VAASAVILAGGKSSRMGFNKAFAKLNRKRFIEIQVEELSKYFLEVMIVSNDPGLYSYLGVKVVTDIIPGKGPLSGIHAELVESCHEECFIVPCDMPFILGGMGKRLIELTKGFDGVVPILNGKLEPLCAVYNKSCIHVIENCLKRDIHKVKEFYQFVNLRYVEADELVETTRKLFYNVNNQTELVKAQLFAGEFGRNETIA